MMENLRDKCMRWEELIIPSDQVCRLFVLNCEDRGELIIPSELQRDISVASLIQRCACSH